MASTRALGLAVEYRCTSGGGRNTQQRIPGGQGEAATECQIDIMGVVGCQAVRPREIKHSSKRTGGSGVIRGEIRRIRRRLSSRKSHDKSSPQNAPLGVRAVLGNQATAQGLDNLPADRQA